MCRACENSQITNHLTSALWRDEPSRRRFLAYAVSAGVAGTIAGGKAHAADSADVIFRNGTIHPMTAAGRPPEALAIGGGKILAAGSASEVSSLANGATRIVDLQGRCLFPGFIDPHHHTVLSALSADLMFDIGYPKHLSSGRRAGRAERGGREICAGPVDSRRVLRQPLAGRRSVDARTGRNIDPASDFRLVRERTRWRRERHGVRARQNFT